MSAQFQVENLLPIAEEIIEPKTFFQAMSFTGQELSNSEHVDLDKDDQGLQVIGYTDPDATAKPVEKQSFDSHSFRIPYIKPVTTIKPSDLRSRMPGESPFSGQDPASRERWLAARSMADLESRIQRTIEIQCSEIADTGIVNVTDDAGNVVRQITFPRDGSTRVTLTGTRRWSESTSDIIGDIEAMQDNANALSGMPPDYFYTVPEVWAEMRDNTKFMSLLDNVSLVKSFGDLTSRLQGVGVRYVGLVNGIPLFVINTRYRRGTTVIRTVRETVFGAANSQAGTMLYGPIYDFNDNEEAIAAVAPRFPTSWIEKNPAARMLQLHSSPLAFTKHWNSFQTWDVLGDA